MRLLYDTDQVDVAQRYEYYRDCAAREIAPVTVHGTQPGYLYAAMTSAQFGDFLLEKLVWASDTPVEAWRTRRLIRASDPEHYRLVLTIDGGTHGFQEQHHEFFGPGDLGLYDTTRPWRAVQPLRGRRSSRTVLLTFPRALLPVPPDKLRPHIGTKLPKLPARRLMVDLLSTFASGTASFEADLERSGTSTAADLIHDCVVGLIRERLDLPGAITPRTRQLVRIAAAHATLYGLMNQPTLNPQQIARAMYISKRGLHKIFRGTGLTPMKLLHDLRLWECRRDLEDPALAGKTIKQIVYEHGYQRQDQFARDFRAAFGMSASELRWRAQNPHHDS